MYRILHVNGYRHQTGIQGVSAGWKWKKVMAMGEHCTMDAEIANS